MGNGNSSFEDDELLGMNEDLGVRPDPGLGKSEDVPLLGMDEDLAINPDRMKPKACAVDPKLDANPRRKAPPINPKTCVEGSVSTGKDGEIYVISNGKWVKAEKRLDDERKRQIRERLEKINAPGRKIMDAAKKESSPTPSKRGRGRPKGSKNKASSPTPSKRGRGRPKGSKNKASSPTPSKRGPGRPKGSKNTPKTPARKRCPNGSRKSSTGKSCVKKRRTVPSIDEMQRR